MYVDVYAYIKCLIYALTCALRPLIIYIAPGEGGPYSKLLTCVTSTKVLALLVLEYLRVR